MYIYFALSLRQVEARKSRSKGEKGSEKGRPTVGEEYREREREREMASRGNTARTRWRDVSIHVRSYLPVINHKRRLA